MKEVRLTKSKVELHKISDMVGGWFIGNFEPTLFKTGDFEVGLKEYTAGAYENEHYHKIATEYTVIIDGRVLMNGIEYGNGDIIVIPPGEATDFKALTDVKTLVVKIPGAMNDKFNKSI
jgi:quercetin dioxygenase-like cupin family protein